MWAVRPHKIHMSNNINEELYLIEFFEKAGRTISPKCSVDYHTIISRKHATKAQFLYCWQAWLCYRLTTYSKHPLTCRW